MYIFSSKRVKAVIFFLIWLSWAIFSLKCGAVALKKRRGVAVAQWFKRWRTSRWRELKKVARPALKIFFFLYLLPLCHKHLKVYWRLDWYIPVPVPYLICFLLYLVNLNILHNNARIMLYNTSLRYLLHVCLFLSIVNISAKVTWNIF